MGREARVYREIPKNGFLSDRQHRDIKVWTMEEIRGKILSTKKKDVIDVELPEEHDISAAFSTPESGGTADTVDSKSTASKEA